MIQKLLFKTMCLAVFVLGFSGITNAQKTVSGTVFDTQTNQTLPGVNVVIKGTTKGTSTNVDGYYELTVPADKDTLVFSFIGYQHQQVEVGDQTEITVYLSPQTLSGEELVVVGYGTQVKKNLTGSVTTVRSADIENMSVANTSSLLQGRMAGVTVSNFASQPGRDNAQIRIRGVGTFNSGQNPLVVIDGVTSTINEFSQIPAADIEKILRRCPKERQTLLFSATVPGPVERLARRYMRDAELLNFSPKEIAGEVDRINTP